MNDSSDVDFIKDQLTALGTLKAARFFGGTGFSAHGTQFGMLIEGVLYFVVNDETRPRYEAMGSPCFSYTTKLREVKVRRYYEVPAEVIEDRERLCALAAAALAAAQASVPARRGRGRVAKA